MVTIKDIKEVITDECGFNLVDRYVIDKEWEVFKKGLVEIRLTSNDERIGYMSVSDENPCTFSWSVFLDSIDHIYANYPMEIMDKEDEDDYGDGIVIGDDTQKIVME